MRKSDNFKNIETVVTHDEAMIRRPPGRGLRLIDYRYDKRLRRSFTVPQPRKASSGGGDWQS